MDRRRGALTPSQRAARAATVAIPVAFLAVFFAWPLVAILRRSLVADGRLDVPWDVLTAASTREIAWFTLWQATVSTLLTMLAGLPLAWALSRFSFRGRGLVEALVLVPFVLPTVVVATAFVALLPDGMEHSVWAILLAHVFFNIAVVVRIVGSYWTALDRRLWDAAATLGAGPFQRQLRLTLPLLAPALASAASIAFLFCFTSFGVILVLGGIHYATLETEIYNQAARLFDLRTAAALALVQLAAVSAVVVSPEPSDTPARGIVKPSPSAAGLVLDRVDKSLGVNVGDTVVSSGWTLGDLSSRYPYNNPIGTVTIVGPPDIDLYARVQVGPFADIDALSEVVILVKR